VYIIVSISVKSRRNRCKPSGCAKLPIWPLHKSYSHNTHADTPKTFAGGSGSAFYCISVHGFIDTTHPCWYDSWSRSFSGHKQQLDHRMASTFIYQIHLASRNGLFIDSSCNLTICRRHCGLMYYKVFFCTDPFTGVFTFVSSGWRRSEYPDQNVGKKKPVFSYTGIREPPPFHMTVPPENPSL